MNNEKRTRSRDLYGIVFKTSADNGYNNMELKTLVIVNANSKKYAKTKAYRMMDKKEMNTDDLWYLYDILELENKECYSEEEYHNVFEYITS